MFRAPWHGWIMALSWVYLYAGMFRQAAYSGKKPGELRALAASLDNYINLIL
jgi:hypothetical protein